jgi:N4-gp56 family major capsid protein
MAINTQSNLPAPQQIYFDNVLLSVEQPDLIHKMCAMKRTMPNKSGNVLRQRRPGTLATAPIPLEGTGTHPALQLMSVMDFDIRLKTYGTGVAIHEDVIMCNQDSVLNEAALSLGINLRETEDQLIRDTLAATPGFINAVGGFNGDTPTNIARSDVDEVVKSLKNHSGKTFLSGQSGENKFGSAPIRNAYMALGHTDLIGQLEEIEGFINTWNYPNAQDVIESEWGSAGNLRFFLSPKGAKETAASLLGADVYDIFCVARDSYTYVDQNNYNSQFIYHGPEHSGFLNLYSTAAWKMRTGCGIVNDAWLVKFRATLG